MAEVNNPHDKFFKRLFGDTATTADFIRYYLPDELVAALDLESLTLESESFLDPKLHEHFSDLLFRVRLTAGNELYVYLLLEHKSAPDKWVAFQLLRYLVRFWERLFEQGCQRLPPVIPIVFYHGAERWRVPLQFSAVVETAGLPILQKYLPDFEYDLRDLSLRVGTEIKGSPRLQTGLSLLRYIFSDDLGQRLPDIFRNLRELKLTDALNWLESLVSYLSSANQQVKEKEIEKAMEQVIHYEELGDAAPFARAWKERWKREGLQEGREEGREEGQQIGRQQGVFSLALRQTQHRFGQLDEVTHAQIRALPNELLEEFGEALLDFVSLTELQHWLADKAGQTTSSLVQ